ncbi:MAG: molybdopterin-dependent oxidoreductase [Epsilonproteobacteria bacterium]|nr:molybdopterin-dependent oxidoreductase [Campylobacterota bacterium]
MLVDSVCAYCGVGCDIAATVEDNEIRSITARPEGRVSEGELCIKGQYGFDFAHSKARLGAVKIKKSFIDKNWLFLPKALRNTLELYQADAQGYIHPPLEVAYDLSAWKIKAITTQHGNFSYASIGGARGNCESAYLFQKFTRKVINSPHIDNCARVCHAPTLKGMRAIIGEGAATNPFSDIQNTEFMIIIGSNTTEGHPIVANKVRRAVKNGAKLAVIDVRDIAMAKSATFNCVIPYESNLLVLNMLAFVILDEQLYDSEFIETRSKAFDTYKREILDDPYANPEFFQKVSGYEYLTEMIREIARTYAKHKSLILWGLGITEHLDGSYAASAICHLAVMSGNIGKSGAGLIPLRGQNNVQGTCDMGCLPYYNPDYEQPLVEGKKTPDIINAIDAGEIKILYNMGEDIAHVHPNQNKVHRALKKLDLLIVNELFDNEVTQFADIVYGVKSTYEKTGVYVNAERRLHLSQPLIHNDLPDDWEVINGIAKSYGRDLGYQSSSDIWKEVQVKVPKRFSGASYGKLEANRINGLQWPITESDLPILHMHTFRTKDGLATFRYKKYTLRGQVKELVNGNQNNFYLTTGRTIAHYNNAAQTKESPRLMKKHCEDLLLGSSEDATLFADKTHVVLRSQYGKTEPLKLKLSKGVKKGTLYTTFHHAKSHINFLYGDEGDELTKTARFKSIKVIVE